MFRQPAISLVRRIMAASVFMSQGIVAAGAKIATAIGALALMVLCTAVIAYWIACRYGRSRPMRKAIFTGVGGAAIIASTFVMRAMLR